MEFRHLGRSGLRVSAIAYGNWLTHGESIDEETARACVRAALDAGITTFDTADVYAGGIAEQVLGRALLGERREGLEIFSKVYWPMGPGQNDAGLSRKHIFEAIHGTLRRLGTEYVDLYQAHRYDSTTPLEETMQAFADVVHGGKALYIGVSEWTADQIRAGADLARELKVPFVSNQPRYNMLWRTIEAEVVPTCTELGISQVVFSPISQGVLTGKYEPGAALPEGTRAASGVNTYGMEPLLADHVLERVQRLRPLAEAAGGTLAQLAVAWVLANPNVASAIVGASRPDQLVENVAALDLTLDDELMAAIDDVLGPAVQRDPAMTGSPSTRPVDA